MNAERRLKSIDRAVGGVGLGTWPLGGPLSVGAKPFGRRAISDETAVDLVRTAVDAGLEFVDTADFYGDGRSEALLGEALAAEPDRVVVCTKFGNRITPDGVIQDFSAAWLRTAVEGSLRRLRRQRLDILLLHSPPDSFDWATYDREPLEALVREGQVGAYGVSCRSAKGAARAIEAGFGSVIEVVYNVVDRRAEAVFPVAEAGGYDLIARMPFAYGLLLDRGAPFAAGDHRGMLSPEERGWLREQSAALAFLDNEEGGFAASALRFALSPPAISVVIPGISRPEQIAAATLAGRLGSLPPAVMARVAEAAPSVYPGWV